MNTLAKLALITLIASLLAAPAFATTAISHETIPVYPAYEGDAQGNARLWAGYSAALPSAATVYPGTLRIEPGDSKWSNFVAAAQAPVSYMVKNVTLTKQSPAMTTCSGTYPGSTITQEGTANIRLNWPLQYEAPGTTWTLVILYSTPTLWDDDGPTGVNPPAMLHVDIWKWELRDDVAHFGTLLSLFHDVGAGASGTPPISDEPLFSWLCQKVNQARQAESAGDLQAVWYILSDVELEVMDSCDAHLPLDPSPNSMYTGILLTSEYPACCKLLADIESILSQTGEVYPSPRPDAAKAPGLSEPGRMPGHKASVRSSYIGDSADNATIYRGYLGSTTGPVAFPGVLGIVPGESWSNFIAAARANVPYTLGDVTLTKTTPAEGNCTGATAATTVTQTNEGIRLWWPLMYETPGTTFTLTVSYQTEHPQRFAGERTASTQHQESWQWTVREDLQALGSLCNLFDATSFGTSGVPLVSDETLYASLSDTLALARTSLAAGDVAAVQSAIGDFGLSLLDACTPTPPDYPNPYGPGTGVINTEDSPAGCRLLTGSASIDAVAAASISDAARSVKDGAAVVLSEPKIATLVQPGFFYAQDQSRVCGIRVIGSIDGLQPGGSVKLRGTIGTDGPERVLTLTGYEVESTTGTLPRSLCVRNCLVGGSGGGSLPGFIDGAGVFNGGLRVTVVGRVKSIGSGWFDIDDGSAQSGLRVQLLPGVNPPTSDYVRVTGVSTWFDSSGLPEPAILVGSAQDVVAVQ